MNTFIALIVIAVVAAVAWELVKVIVGDGFGHRPPPPSHHDDLDAGASRWGANAAH